MSTKTSPYEMSDKSNCTYLPFDIAGVDILKSRHIACICFLFCFSNNHSVFHFPLTVNSNNIQNNNAKTKSFKLFPHQNF